ncbi:MAG: AsmA family protein [Alphaproteobacteria bacterium]|nr:AsmA family protein [Alphaproteobacteria bacterium]
MKKRILLGFLGILVIGLILAGIFLENIVKSAVYKFGSQITGTEVTLNGFNLSPLSGEVAIKGLSVANPEKYKSKDILTLGGVAVKVNLSSLLSDTVIIEYITVDKPVITYEMLSLTQNNIKQLQANISKNTASPAPSADSEKIKTQQVQEASSKKVIINKVSINEGELKAVAGQELVDVKLPKIELTNIGGSSKKESSSIIASVTTILNKILAIASETAVKSGLNNLKDVAEKNLNNVVGGVKDKVKSFGIFGK